MLKSRKTHTISIKRTTRNQKAPHTEIVTVRMKSTQIEQMSGSKIPFFEDSLEELFSDFLGLLQTIFRSLHDSAMCSG